jgi:hypothetical protein
MNLDDKIKAIYDFEKNCSISWFWDNGYTAKIGDEINGIRAEKTFTSINDAVDWLYDMSL